MSVVSKIDEILQSDIVQIDLKPDGTHCVRLRHCHFGSETQVDGHSLWILVSSEYYPPDSKLSEVGLHRIQTRSGESLRYSVHTKHAISYLPGLWCRPLAPGRRPGKGQTSQSGRECKKAGGTGLARDSSMKACTVQVWDRGTRRYGGQCLWPPLLDIRSRRTQRVECQFVF